MAPCFAQNSTAEREGRTMIQWPEKTRFRTKIPTFSNPSIEMGLSAGSITASWDRQLPPKTGQTKGSRQAGTILCTLLGKVTSPGVARGCSPTTELWHGRSHQQRRERPTRPRQILRFTLFGTFYRFVKYQAFGKISTNPLNPTGPTPDKILE